MADASYAPLDTLDDFTAAGVPRLWGVLLTLDADEDWGLASAGIVGTHILSVSLTCGRLRAHKTPHAFRGAGRLIDALAGSLLDTLDCRYHCDSDGDRGGFLFVHRRG
jgi:hypothetical protein